MRSAASRTPRRRAGLVTASAVAAAVLGFGPASALAQSCLPPQQPPPDCGCMPPPPAFTVHRVADSPSATEGKGSVKFTIMLGADQCDAVATYRTADGTAHAGEDYKSTEGEVALDQQFPEAEVTVDLIDDAIDENDETFDLNVDGADG